VLGDGAQVVVNQGLHGIAAYRSEESGFTQLGSVKPGNAVREIVISTCSRYLAVLLQDSASVSRYELTEA
jgi:hypothetical protein